MIFVLIETESLILLSYGKGGGGGGGGGGLGNYATPTKNEKCQDVP